MVTNNQEIKLANLDLKKITTESGVYLFHNQKGKIIYVGKARNLRQRLTHYFQTKLTGKTIKITNQAYKITLITTPSDFDALLLEAKLIKQYQPKYNVSLKDDKHYLYIKISKETYPQVGTAREKDSQATLFGPFPSAKTVRLILKQIRKVFSYRSCHRLPKKPCPYYHLNLCPAPCINNTPKDKQKYHRQIRAIKRILSGESKKLIKHYNRQMISAAKKMTYEKANQFKKIRDGLVFLTKQRIDPNLFWANLDLKDDHRNRLKSLKKLLSDYFPNLINLNRIEAYDIANISGQNTTGSMVVFTRGWPDNSQYRQFKIKQAQVNEINDPKMIAEILLRRLNHPDWPKPDLIIIDGGKAQLNAALGVLREKNFDLPVLGLAKREETIVIKRKDGFKLINLDPQSPPLLLLKAVRDEAHRFAQRYHHQLRKKQIIK